MSSKAFKVSKNTILNDPNNDISFNFSHSRLQEMLENIGHYTPFDSGGMGVPLVIYKEEMLLLQKECICEKDRDIINIIKKDMGKDDFILYYLV